MPLHLGEPAESLGLEPLADELQLGEVVFEARVGEIGERLGPQRLHDRSELAHRPDPGSIVPFPCSNM